MAEMEALLAGLRASQYRSAVDSQHAGARAETAEERSLRLADQVYCALVTTSNVTTCPRLCRLRRHLDARPSPMYRLHACWMSWHSGQAQRPSDRRQKLPDNSTHDSSRHSLWSWLSEVGSGHCVSGAACGSSDMGKVCAAGFEAHEAGRTRQPGGRAAASGAGTCCWQGPAATPSANSRCARLEEAMRTHVRQTKRTAWSC